jgi:hypothetical protein
MLYEVALNISYYRYDPVTAPGQPEAMSGDQGFEYCTVIIEADTEWNARHGAIKIAAEHYRSRFDESYYGDSRLGRHTVRPARAGAKAGTVKELGTKIPNWVQPYGWPVGTPDKGPFTP